MSLRHIGEPRRLMIRGVLLAVVVAWAIVFVRHGARAAADRPWMTQDRTAAPKPTSAAAATPGRPATTTAPVGR